MPSLLHHSCLATHDCKSVLQQPWQAVACGVQVQLAPQTCSNCDADFYHHRLASSSVALLRPDGPEVAAERARLGKADSIELSQLVMACDTIVTGTPLALRAVQTRPAPFVRSYMARVEPMLSRLLSVLAYSRSKETFVHQCPSCGFGGFSEPRKYTITLAVSVADTGEFDLQPMAIIGQL
jgi:hypothetical protein